MIRAMATLCAVMHQSQMRHSFKRLKGTFEVKQKIESVLAIKEKCVLSNALVTWIQSVYKQEIELQRRL